MILFTGVQRSGTKYIATVLSKAGIKATHECGKGVDPRNGPRFDVDVDVNWLAAWWLPMDATVVHLVRNPYQSIASSLQRGTFSKPRPYGKWAMSKLPRMQECDSDVERCIYYYIKWNNIVENHAKHRIRIEDVTSDILYDILSDNIADINKGKLEKAINETPVTTNTNKRGQEVTKEYVLQNSTKKLDEKAKRYGYFDSDHGT